MRQIPNTHQSCIKVALVTLVSCFAVGCVTQSTGTYDGAMTITVENDTFTGSDNNYTNGIGATWNSNEISTYDDDSFVRKWAGFWSFLPFASDDGYQTYASWSFAQEMHTPDEITDPNPPPDDQPYAGVLYLDNVLYARRGRTTHAWALKVGVAGPASQAEDVQKWFHDVVGADEPMGWDTQLPDEVLVNVAYSVAHLWAQGDVGKSAEWRVVPVGTVASATTSRVSRPACTARSAGTWWMPWVCPRFVQASMPQRPSVSGRSMAGPLPFTAGWADTALHTICRSTARCSATAARSIRSPSSAPVRSASPCGIAASS